MYYDNMQPKGELHGTPPKRSPPHFSRSVCFKANKNPLGDDMSSVMGSLMISKDRLNRHDVQNNL